MTTHIDNEYTRFLCCAFSLQKLKTMEKEQSKVMREAFICGAISWFNTGKELGLEFEQFCTEVGTEVQYSKAQLCLQKAVDALIIVN